MIPYELLKIALEFENTQFKPTALNCVCGTFHLELIYELNPKTSISVVYVAQNYIAVYFNYQDIKKKKAQCFPVEEWTSRNEIISLFYDWHGRLLG
ncbi:MAG: hypothetical protein HC908_17990 [Calothrix sp. SM1_7_51]|nr:hypothetical protein [Calothrix sp. SM1_7_51]